MTLKLLLGLLLVALASEASAQSTPPSPPYPAPPSRTEVLPPPPPAVSPPPPGTLAPPPGAVPVAPQAQQQTPPPAAALAPVGPEPQHQGDVIFVSGGAGDEDRAALRQMARDFNLRLQFAIQGSGEYIAGVNVTMTDAKGKTVLDTIADGPLFFAKVPPGKYRIIVAQGGRTLTRDVTVPPNAAAAQAFYWPPAG